MVTLCERIYLNMLLFALIRIDKSSACGTLYKCLNYIHRVCTDTSIPGKKGQIKTAFSEAHQNSENIINSMACAAIFMCDISLKELVIFLIYPIDSRIRV